MAAHRLPEVTVVADAGMLSRGQPGRDLEDAGLRFIVGARIPDVPYQVSRMAPRPIPVSRSPTGRSSPSRGIMGTKADPRRRTIFYQYRADRARRTLKGIDQQIAKAEKAVAGQAAVKRNRFVQLTGGTKSVNRDLEAKARALAGLKGYVTNLEAPTAEYVIGAYHQLWQIEKSFRMSKTDLRARPIYHHKRDSIEAHLTIVFAALAVTRWLERATGWSIKKLVTDPPPLPQHRHPSRRPRPPCRHTPRRAHPRRAQRNQDTPAVDTNLSQVGSRHGDHCRLSPPETRVRRSLGATRLACSISLEYDPGPSSAVKRSMRTRRSWYLTLASCQWLSRSRAEFVSCCVLNWISTGRGAAGDDPQVERATASAGHPDAAGPGGADGAEVGARTHRTCRGRSRCRRVWAPATGRRDLASRACRRARKRACPVRRRGISPWVGRRR